VERDVRSRRRGVTLDVAERQIAVLIGRNDVGKTGSSTSLAALAGGHVPPARATEQRRQSVVERIW